MTGLPLSPSLPLGLGTKEKRYSGTGQSCRVWAIGDGSLVFSPAGPRLLGLWSASQLTFMSQTCTWIWLLPGAQVYKQKTSRANKNIISLVFESAAPDVSGGRGGAEPARARPACGGAGEECTGAEGGPLAFISTAPPP